MVIVYTTGSIYDDFGNRSEGTTWGSASSGPAYSYPIGLPGGVVLAVAGGVGTVAIPGGVSQVQIRWPVNVLWTALAGFVASYDIQLSTIHGSGNRVDIDFFHGSGGAPPMNVVLSISSDPAEGLVAIYAGTVVDSVVKTDWLANTWYTVKLERVPVIPIFRMKIWPRDGTEPESWLLQNAGAFTQSNNPLDSFLQFSIDNVSSTIACTLSFDNFIFGGGGLPTIISGR